MISLAQLLRATAAELAQRSVGFALVGGLAVSALTDARFTRDLDLAVAVDGDDEAERLILDLSSTFRPVASVEHEGLGRLAMVRLAPTQAGADHATPVVDLLFASSGIEPEVVAGARPIEVFTDTEVPLASIGHLLALKVLSVDATRRVDEQDIINLLDVATHGDLDTARAALELITRRGAARHKDLLGDLDAYVAHYGGPDAE